MSKTSVKKSGIEVKIFPIVNGIEREPFTVLPAPPKLRTPKGRGFHELDCLIEVEAGQRYGMNVILHPEFDWMDQPTVAITYNIDGGAICLEDMISGIDDCQPDGGYESVMDRFEGTRAFTFADRELDEDSSQTSHGSKDPFGKIRISINRGDGKFILTTQKDRFGCTTEDTEPVSTTKGTKTSINKDGKQLHTKAVDIGGTKDDETWWIDWAYPGNLPIPLSEQQRAKDPIYELISFTFHYRTKAYLGREGFKRTKKRKGKRRNFQPDPRNTIVIAGSERGDDEDVPIEQEMELHAEDDSLSEVGPGYEASHRSGHEVEDSERDSPAYSGPALPSDRDSLYRQTPVPIKQESPDPQPELPAENDSLYGVTLGYESRNTSDHGVEGEVPTDREIAQPIMESTRPSANLSPGYEIDEEVAIKQETAEPQQELPGERDDSNVASQREDNEEVPFEQQSPGPRTKLRTEADNLYNAFLGN